MTTCPECKINSEFLWEDDSRLLDNVYYINLGCPECGNRFVGEVRLHDLELRLTEEKPKRQ